MRFIGYALLSLLSGDAYAFSTAAPPAIPSVLDIPPPPDLPSSVATDLANDGVAVVPNYACIDTVNLLRFDALRLQHAGLAQAAGTFRANRKKTPEVGNDRVGGSRTRKDDNSSKGGDPYRKCKHFWLSGKRNVGHSYISDLVSTLEDEVEGTSPFSNENTSDLTSRNKHDTDADDEVHAIHRRETEAAYLYYEKGGYYNWHIDTPDETTVKVPCDEDENKPQTHRRAFSFLLYLGGHKADLNTGNVSPWDADTDGGELRVYPQISLEDQHRRIDGIQEGERSSEAKKSNDGNDGCLVGDPTGRTDFSDIVPQEGTLVIFKSEAICHEVLITNRERLAVVGWIHGNLK